MYKEKGITLIALIITIIIMLILAVVTINILVNGGLFKQAEEAADQTREQIFKEQLETDIVAYRASGYNADTSEPISLEGLRQYLEELEMYTVDGAIEEITVSPEEIIKFIRVRREIDNKTYEAIIGEDLTIIAIIGEGEDIPVTELRLNKSDITVIADSTETLVVTVLPIIATDRTVTWSSSNPNIATVDANGTVTGVNAGVATITVTAGDKSATCTVTVREYIEDGLVALFDGENNQGPGQHDSSATTWKNLITGQKDGSLLNFDATSTSGWTENSIILDGINDVVQLGSYNYGQGAIEVVFKPLKNHTAAGHVMSNLETGGRAIFIGPFPTHAQAHIGGTYRSAMTAPAEIGKRYSVSARNDGNLLYNRTNATQTSIAASGAVGSPLYSMPMVLGCNPGQYGNNESYANVEIFSVRIYSRCLTEEEVMNNYEIDKIKFNLED